MKAAISVYQILEFSFDPENKARLIQWLADAITNNKLLYSSPLNLDYDKLLKQLKKDAKMAEEQQKASLDPLGGASGKQDATPGKAGKDKRPEIPKVKMARADSEVVQLLEHLRDAPKP